MAAHQPLQRQLGVFGATLLGLGSILGTGVFVSIGIAAGVVGSGVLVATVLAGLLALCNALSSAQLAAAHPVAGGTYEYGYQFLRPALGFTAGWVFLAAKSASAATAALGVTGYLAGWLGVPNAWETAGALVVVALVTALVLCGVRRSNVGNAVLVTITLAALGLFVGLGLFSRAPGVSLERVTQNPIGSGGGPTLLHATALMFVAYTGYGRIATMGEEVRHPRRTIPAAIIATLAVSAAVYVAVGLVIASVDVQRLAEAQGRAPLEVIVASVYERPSLAWAMAVGACAAMGGVLLNLLLGLSRVVLAMARRDDAPKACARVNRSGTTPAVAVLVVAVIIAGLVMVGDVRATWTFSAFTVLIYYGLTNAAALRLPPEHRLYPRAFAWAGLAACFGLAFFVPWRVWVIGLGVIALGLLWHAAAKRMKTD